MGKGVHPSHMGAAAGCIPGLPLNMIIALLVFSAGLQVKRVCCDGNLLHGSLIPGS